MKETINPKVFYEETVVPHLLKTCDEFLSRCGSDVFFSNSCDVASNMCFLASATQQPDNII